MRRIHLSLSLRSSSVSLKYRDAHLLPLPPLSRLRRHTVVWKYITKTRDQHGDLGSGLQAKHLRKQQLQGQRRGRSHYEGGRNYVLGHGRRHCHIGHAPSLRDWRYRGYRPRVRLLFGRVVRVQRVAALAVREQVL